MANWDKSLVFSLLKLVLIDISTLATTNTSTNNNNNNCNKKDVIYFRIFDFRMEYTVNINNMIVILLYCVDNLADLLIYANRAHCE